MPISPLDIAATNAAQALHDNKFISAKVNMIIQVLLRQRLIAVCDACSGSGYIQPATAVPGCERCCGAGFTPADTYLLGMDGETVRELEKSE